MGAESAANGTYVALVIALALAAGVGFALFLQLTTWGRWLEREYMFVVVIIGVVIVLAALMFLVSWRTIELIFLTFAAVGLPIIIRAFHNLRKTDRQVAEALRK